MHDAWRRYKRAWSLGAGARATGSVVPAKRSRALPGRARAGTQSFFATRSLGPWVPAHARCARWPRQRSISDKTNPTCALANTNPTQEMLAISMKRARWSVSDRSADAACSVASAFSPAFNLGSGRLGMAQPSQGMGVRGGARGSAKGYLVHSSNLFHPSLTIVGTCSRRHAHDAKLAAHPNPALPWPRLHVTR